MKLIRDKIPQIIKDQGREPLVYLAAKEEYERRLLDKMIEELEEFRQQPCIEEAADMYSVLEAICDHWGWDLPQVYEASCEKNKARGGFKNRVIFIGVKNEDE